MNPFLTSTLVPMMSKSPFHINRDYSGVAPERLLTFGDGVFAIAITLLVLDIKFPEGLSDSEVGGAFRDSLPEVGSYLLSFAVIASLWLTQHLVLKVVKKLDGVLLYLYLALLAVVAALPFPTRLMSEYGGTGAVTAVYAAAIAVAAALIAAMAARVLRKPALADFVMDVGELRGLLWQQLILAAVFCWSVPIAFLSPGTAKYWWLLAFPCRVLYWWVDSQEQRKGTGQALLEAARALQRGVPGPDSTRRGAGDASV